MTQWQQSRAARDARIDAGAKIAKHKMVAAADATRLLEAVLRPGDRVCLEGDNQKQADLLSAALLAADPSTLNGLHMVQSGVVLPAHLDLFDRGIARRLDYAYSGPQSARIAQMLCGGKIELGAVHTCLEHFGSDVGMDCCKWREIGHDSDPVLIRTADGLSLAAPGSILSSGIS